MSSKDIIFIFKLKAFLSFDPAFSPTIRKSKLPVTQVLKIAPLFLAYQ